MYKTKAFQFLRMGLVESVISGDLFPSYGASLTLIIQLGFNIVNKIKRRIGGHFPR